MSGFQEPENEPVRYTPPIYRLGLYLMILAGSVVLGFIAVVSMLWGD